MKFAHWDPRRNSAERFRWGKDCSVKKTCQWQVFSVSRTAMPTGCRERGPGCETCEDVSTKCLPKNPRKPLGRKGFRIARFSQSTRRLPMELSRLKTARFLRNRAVFMTFPGLLEVLYSSNIQLMAILAIIWDF